jgi:hypothetical protein
MRVCLAVTLLTDMFNIKSSKKHNSDWLSLALSNSLLRLSPGPRCLRNDLTLTTMKPRRLEKSCRPLERDTAFSMSECEVKQALLHTALNHCLGIFPDPTDAPDYIRHQFVVFNCHTQFPFSSRAS